MSESLYIYMHTHRVWSKNLNLRLFLSTWSRTFLFRTVLVYIISFGVCLWWVEWVCYCSVCWLTFINLNFWSSCKSGDFLVAGAIVLALPIFVCMYRNDDDFAHNNVIILHPDNKKRLQNILSDRFNATSVANAVYEFYPKSNVFDLATKADSITFLFGFACFNVYCLLNSFFLTIGGGVCEFQRMRKREREWVSV